MFAVTKLGRSGPGRLTALTGKRVGLTIPIIRGSKVPAPRSKRALLNLISNTQMEENRYFPEEELPRAREELSRDRWSKEWQDRFSVRSHIKDLRDRLDRTADFANRQRAIELADQLLTLVSPINENIEWNDEWRRKLARGLDPASPEATEYYNDPRIRP